MATDEIIPNKLVLNTRSFGVVISRTEENDGYIANIPSLNTCFAFGDTIEQAMTNLHDALKGTLEVMVEDGLPITDDSKNMEMMITVPMYNTLNVAI